MGLRTSNLLRGRRRDWNVVVEQLVRANGNQQSVEKHMETLMEISSHDGVEVAMFNAPNLMQTVLKECESSEASYATKLCGLLMLQNLSVADDILAPIFNTPRLMAWVIDAIGDESSDELIIVTGLNVLVNLSTSSDIDVPMFSTPGLMDVVLAAIDNGDNELIVSAALTVLRSLSCPSENEVPMFRTPRLVEVVFNAIENGPTQEIVVLGVELLGSLAHGGENQLPMFKTPRLFDVVCTLLEQSRNSVIELACLQLFIAISNCSNVVADSMSVRVEFVRLITAFISYGKKTSSSARVHAFFLLLNLSYSPSSQKLLDSPAMLTMLAAFLKKRNKMDKLLATSILANIIGTDASRSAMLTSDLVTLKDLVGNLKSALNDETRYEFSWPLCETLLPLCSLSRVDVNRAGLLKAQVFPLLTQSLQVSLVQDDFRSAEYAIAIFAQFCVDAKYFTLLKSNAQLVQLLGQVLTTAASSWSTARRDASSLNSQLNGKPTAVVAAVSLP